MNTRELILDMLLEMEKQRTYSNILIRKVLDKYDYLPAKEKAFIKRVTEGTLERRLQIDWLLDGFSSIRSEEHTSELQSLAPQDECVPAPFHGWDPGFRSMQ